MTLSTQEQRQADKARELIDAVDGLENAAEIAGLSTSQLQRYCSKTERDSMPARVIEQLEAVSHGRPHHPIFTRYLARRQGFVLVPLPDAVPGDSEWAHHISRLSDKAGGLISGLALDLADDQKIDAREAAARLALAHSLVETAVEIEAALARRANGSG